MFYSFSGIDAYKLPVLYKAIINSDLSCEFPVICLLDSNEIPILFFTLRCHNSFHDSGEQGVKENVTFNESDINYDSNKCPGTGGLNQYSNGL